VPGEVLRVGAEGGLRGEGERTAVEVGELEVRTAGEDGFGDVGLGDADAEVVVDGPEAGVEEVVGRRGQGQGTKMGSDPITSGSLTPSATLWLKGSDHYVVA
jgi:hypothetical protein